MKTLEEFNAHYKAVRARLNAGPPAIKKPPPPKVIEPGNILVFPIKAPTIEFDLEPKPSKPKVARVNNAGTDNVVMFYTLETPAQIILREVAAKHEMPMTVFKNESRKKPFVLCRQEAAYRLKEEAKLSLTQIGRLFNHQDHTTVLNSINRYKANTEQGRIPWFKTKKENNK
jgi:hypothetical protein